MQWNSKNQFHMHITPRIKKRFWSKVRVFWNTVAVGFEMVGWQKQGCFQITALGRPLLKNVSAVVFSGKPISFDSVPFHNKNCCN